MSFRLAFYLLPLLVVGSSSLICYETNAEDGKVTENNCTTCNYCVVSLDSLDPSVPAYLFGVGPDNDQTEVYDQVFAHRTDKQVEWAGRQSVNMYQVLSTCILERYYDPWAATSSTYMFRCVCDYDRCNKGLKLDTYLHKLTDDYDYKFTGFMDSLQEN